MDYRNKITCRRERLTTVDGRDRVEETESNRGRIIQSAAIRRLQQKTQVYPLETNAAVRSRLTHSLEVQQTGRFIARKIIERLKSDNQLSALGLEGIEVAFTNLVEMSCLMHDIGNPPFGHFGEAAINDWMSRNGEPCFIKASGSNDLPGLLSQTLLPDLMTFEGNAQGLRIIHSLQQLNLTYSQIAALVKYTRPAWQPKPEEGSAFFYRQKKPGWYFSEQTLIDEVWEHLAIARGNRFPLVYIMEAADDIAYCIADLEDAVDKGILNLRELQQLLRDEWELQCDQAGVSGNYLPGIVELALEDHSETHIFMTRFRTRLVKDLVAYAVERYCEHHQEIFDGELDEPLIDGDSVQHLALLSLKWVARKHVFSQPEVETPELRGYAALTGLLDIYRPLLEISTADFQDVVNKAGSKHFICQRLYHRMSVKHKQAYDRAVSQLNEAGDDYTALEWYYRCRLVLDYLTGMTDHFVLTEYQCLSAI